MIQLAYKLLRRRKDLSLGPLFINRTQVIPIGCWLEAELHPTKGYQVRKGWHVMQEPKAPHLSMTGRVWCTVQIEDFAEYRRPLSQGGMWWLAQRMKVISINV